MPAALSLLGFGIGVPPFVTLLGSDLLGLIATVAAVVTSVRLGQGDAGLTEQRRQLVLGANLALVLLCVFAGIGLRQQIGYNTQQVVYASEASYLQGPDGGISNIYAFDADGRPLDDIQLFDQEGRPLDTLLLQAPDGTYAEPVRALDEYGTEVANVFPRTLLAEVWDETGGYRVEPVPRPAIAPRRLASPSPSPSPEATQGPSASPGPSPEASPEPAALEPSPAGPSVAPSAEAGQPAP